MPRVSVVIPTHNRAGYLREAIGSVIAQSFRDWECLVVDDESSDGTARMVAELAARDGRVRYLRQARFGRAARGRNLALRSSDAPLCAFLDDDDLWYPEKLALQVAVMEAHPEVGLVFAKIRKVGLKRQIWPAEQVALRPTFADLLRGNIVATSTALARRSALEAAGPAFDESLIAVEDYDLWLRIARRAGLYALPQVLCDYRVHAGGGSLQRLDTELDEITAIYDRLERDGVDGALLRAGRRKLHLRRIPRAGGARGALRELWRALRT